MESKALYIESNEELKSSLAVFASKVVGDKKFLFPVENYDFSRCLIDEKIIKIEFDNYKIIDLESVAYGIFCYYKGSLSYDIKPDFFENVEFLKLIDKDFKFNDFISGLSTVKDFFWQYAIFESNKRFGCEFVEYLGSISRENNVKELYKFNNAYSNALHELIINVENLYGNTLRLLFLLTEESSSHDGNVINLNFSSVFNGLKRFSESNYLVGSKLLEFALNQEIKNENLISSVITGLYECGRESFFDLYLNNIISEGKYSYLVFFGLSGVTKVSELECDLFIKLFDEFKDNVKLTRSVLSLLVSVLKSSNEAYFQACFERIIDMLDSESNAYFILNNICYIDKCESNKADLIVSLINKEFFDFERYIKIINSFFMYIESVECFEKVITELVNKNPFKSVSKVFTSYLHSADKQKLDKFLIKFLIDNKASKRYLARELYEELSSGKSYKFAFDVLSLPPVEQYKLWVGLCQGFREPKYYIPALLPLIDSENEIVKESFLCKLEEISEDYGGAILKILNKNLNEQNDNHKLIKNRIDKYIESYYNKNVNLKYPIKELNPYHANNKDIRLFNKLHFKNMSQSVQEGAEKDSIFGQLGIGTVQLAKGGGWIIGENRDISKLGSVRSSFSLPRGYFVYPDEFELYMDFEIKADWTQEDFMEIEKFIVSG